MMVVIQNAQQILSLNSFLIAYFCKIHFHNSSHQCYFACHFLDQQITQQYHSVIINWVCNCLLQRRIILLQIYMPNHKIKRSTYQIDHRHCTRSKIVVIKSQLLEVLFIAMTTKNEECLDSFQRDFGYKEERRSMASGQVHKGVQQENCSRSF